MEDSVGDAADEVISSDGVVEGVSPIVVPLDVTVKADEDMEATSEAESDTVVVREVAMEGVLVAAVAACVGETVADDGD